MIKSRNKVCILCGRDNEPHFSKKRCKSCASKSYSKPERTAIKKKPKEATGEREVFLKIWKERPHVCTNCQDPLGNEPLAHFFAHILSKKRRPDLKLDPNNIMILCSDCHYAYDFRSKEEFEKRKKL